MTLTVGKIAEFLDLIAPRRQACQWDNVGLQVGKPGDEVEGILVSLEVTEEVIEEACGVGANLIITHHPLIFKPLASINTSQRAGKMILKLLAGGINLFCAHTNLDKSFAGTGRALGERLGLKDLGPLGDKFSGDLQMVYRGNLHKPLPGAEFVNLLKKRLGISSLKMVGSPDSVESVALIPGSGGSLIKSVIGVCDLVVTGEIGYHDALEASYANQAVAAVGHFISEKPAMYMLSEILREKFPDLPVFVSGREAEPFETV